LSGVLHLDQTTPQTTVGTFTFPAVVTSDLGLLGSGYSSNLIPTMTSHSAPSGLASASHELAGVYVAWYAFRNQNPCDAAGWAVAWTGNPEWLQYQFGTGNVVTKYSITTRGESGTPRAPKTWVFAGSNDGSSWTQLDAQTDITDWASSANETKNFVLSNTDSYSYYRVTISASNDASYCGIGNLMVYASSGSIINVTNVNDIFTFETAIETTSLTETTPTLLKLDQTTPQSTTGVFDFLGGLKTTIIYDNNAGVKVADFTSPFRIFYDASEVAKITLGSSGGPIILNEFVGGAGGFLKSSTAGEIQLDSTTYLASGGWYDTAQGNISLSGFNNDLGNYGGWLTYWDTISGADYANTANYAYSSGYADSSGYASSCDYANYWGGYSFPYYSGSPASQYIGWDSTGAFGAFAISSLFDSWVAGTPVAPSGVAEFNDGASNYFRVWNLANSSLSQWSDGTNTMTIGGTSGLDYVAGASDVDVRLNGTYVHLIDAGTSLPFSYQNTKDSTDTVIELGRLSRKTTGTAGDGIGGALPVYLTNDNGDQEIFAQTDVVGTDVSDGSEDGKYVFKTMVAGTLTPIAEINDTIELKETVWDDLNFDPDRSGGPVATRPDSVTINNVFHVEFTSANNQLCGSAGELPHKYKLGTDLSPHAHIFLKSGESSGTTGVTFTVYWELRQTTGTTSGSTTLSATSAELASTAGSNKLNIFDSAFTGSNELGAQLALTIARTGGNAGDIIVTTYGVHYELDTMGSRTISSK
jgi:hypothetical protein